MDTSSHKAHRSAMKSSGCSISQDESVLLSEFFSVLGDATRIRILSELFESELCVSDICLKLGVSQSAVSHQLRMLRQLRMVKYRKEGKNIYYSLADDHIQHIVFDGLEHLRED